MEQQQKERFMTEVQSKNQMIATCDDLIDMIRRTYSASTQKQQKDAENMVMTLLKKPGFMERLFQLMTAPTQMKQQVLLVKSCAVLIKKVSYQYSKQQGDKSSFIEMLINIILSERADFVSKDILGPALEFQFNQDQENVYRKIVIDRVLTLLVEPQQVKNVEGLMIICLAYLNSLVDIEEQIQFFQFVIGNIHFAALNLLKQINGFSLEEWVYRDKQIMPKIAKIMEFIETSIERVIDEQQYFDTELKAIRQNNFLVGILENFLPLFNNNGSLISLIYPQINESKRVMVNIITLLYANHKCPMKIFNTIYITLLVECPYTNRDGISESILISCMEILSMHLQKKHYYKVYRDNLVQTIMALFMYSITSKQEYEALNNNPEQFSDIAEYYASGDDKYYNLKVKASILIRMMAEKVDEAMKHFIQILVTIMTSTLEVSPGDSEIMSEVKSLNSKFDIYGLTNQQKLETSLMMLCTLCPFVYRRQDIGHLVYAFFISQFDVFQKTSSTIVILRLMRIVSCYSVSLYFKFIEDQIKKGKVFAIEGLKCFEKILQTNQFKELFSYLAKIMTNLVGEVSITDSLMQLIVINNFETMVKNNGELYAAILAKIRRQFDENKSSNEHATLICFNLLYSMIKKEKQPDEMFSLMQLFFEMSRFLQLDENFEILQKYDEKIVEIQELIIAKNSFIPEQIDAFVVNSLKHLSLLETGTQYFKLYNHYIFKLTGCTYKLVNLFSAFWNEVKIRFHSYLEGNEYSDGISYFCFLMSEIMANHCKIDLSEDDLRLLLVIAEKVPDSKKQYPLVVFLTNLYLLPYPVSTFLKRSGLYEGFLSAVVKIDFDGVIIKRIFVLALIKLLEIEEDQNSFVTILVFCIDHLNKQCSKQKMMVEKPIEARPRNFEEEDRTVQKKNVEVQQNDNQLVNLFVKFVHPFNNLSEFDQFKVIFWQNDHHANELSPELKASLKTILQTEWVNNKARRIIHIKK